MLDIKFGDDVLSTIAPNNKMANHRIKFDDYGTMYVQDTEDTRASYIVLNQRNSNDSLLEDDRCISNEVSLNNKVRKRAIAFNIVLTVIVLVTVSTFIFVSLQ